MKSTNAVAEGQLKGIVYERDPSERTCVLIKMLNALKLSFKELTSVKKKNAIERFQAKHGKTDKIISELSSDRWLWKGKKYTNLM